MENTAIKILVISILGIVLSLWMILTTIKSPIFFGETEKEPIFGT